MAGGYAVFMLMNKLPEEPLDYDMFWKKEEQTREDIWRAFKVALMNVWECALKPQDCSMRNLI
ncbi:hypothetical protein EJ02DRAFT_418131 [Clathrospora elynae]|uniref:Uncharacterized protein n=1 Tax=Clathrospora elynae TaxID=706981 RepID=A0A6A5T2C0_9PLEO|nr:hypothetical protein EJ02DRAFT_418131 [Clathrospora elynae]